MTSHPVRVIGIDPGSRVTGFGVIETQAGRQRALTFGCIRVKDAPLPERLLEIQNALASVVREFAPQEAAVEEVFVKRHAASAVVLGEARGVALCTMAAAGIAVSEYATARVKLAVTGSGRAEKPQVAQMVKILLKLPAAPAADAADALAVALCHAHMRTTLTSIARALA